MNLTPMRYKTFVWPHNPKVYEIEYKRKMAVNKVPFGRYYLQDLGITRRVMKGEGEFVGEGAYDQFKELAALFYENSPGVLIHPLWQTANAYFVGLSLAQEPRADYVKYSFEFWECYDLYATEGTTVTVSGTSASAGTSTAQSEDGSAVWHTVVKGETLWGLSQQYGTTVSALLALNPDISNPNRIYVGQKVKVMG
jgi:hypothetical protein